MKLFISLTLALGCFVSCIENNPDSNSSTVEASPRPLTNTLLKEQKLSCENSTNCSPLVAKVVIQPFGQKNIITCTGFLIEKNVIMTHPSCLKGFQALDNCSENIRVVFAETHDIRAENVECQRLFSYEKVPQNHDQLYIKIDSSQSRRDFFQLLKSELPNKTHYTVININQSPDNRNATLSMEKCQTQFNGLMLPDYKSDKARNITFGECILGNTSLGAPVLNSEQEVVAYIYSTLSEKKIRDLDIDLNVFKKFPKGLATAESFYCKKLPEIYRGYSEKRCNSSSFSRTPVSAENIYYSLNDFYLNTEMPLSFINEWSKTLKIDFAKWDQNKIPIYTEDNRIDRKRFMFHPQIRCLKPFENWAKYTKKSGLKKMPPMKDIGKTNLPIWLAEPMFNQDGILELNAEATDFSYNVNPRVYIKYHENNVTPVTTETTLVSVLNPETAFEELSLPEYMRILADNVKIEKLNIPDCL